MRRVLFEHGKRDPVFVDDARAEEALLDIKAELDFGRWRGGRLDVVIGVLIDAQDTGVLIDAHLNPWKLNPAQRAGVGGLLARALEQRGEPYFRDGITYYAENGVAKAKVGH